jgi:hypothetical protein
VTPSSGTSIYSSSNGDFTEQNEQDKEKFLLYMNSSENISPVSSKLSEIETTKRVNKFNIKLEDQVDGNNQNLLVLNASKLHDELNKRISNYKTLSNTTNVSTFGNRKTGMTNQQQPLEPLSVNSETNFENEIQLTSSRANLDEPLKNNQIKTTTILKNVTTSAQLKQNVNSNQNHLNISFPIRSNQLNSICRNNPPKNKQQDTTNCEKVHFFLKTIKLILNIITNLFLTKKNNKKQLKK